MNLDEFLSRFQNVRKAGGGTTAKCSAHDDTHNSLSINEADGKILIKCHAGCETEAVLSAAGLKLADLFSENGQAKPYDPVIERYVYTDESGKPLYRVCRTAAKNFFQERFQSGVYIPGLKDTRRVLYNLPEVLKAKTVDIVEGEKDVETLRAHGLVATTNAGGADGKWNDSYITALKGKRVAIIPDNDEPGRQHALKVAKAILAVAEQVKIVELPDVPAKGDTSDYLKTHSKAELLALIKAAEPFVLEKWEQGTVTNDDHLTDMANAKRYARQHGEIIRYCHQRAEWLVWSGMHWQWDQTGAAIALGKQTVRSIYGEAEREPDAIRRRSLGDWARKSENDARIRAMLHLAQSELPVCLDALDGHPFLFNCQNGVIDLKTGELLPHEPKYFLTQISPCNYYPDARCERFEAVLKRAMNDRESLIKFVQRAAGYCLSGDVKEQVILFLYGLGANGKTILVLALLYVLGGYGAPAAPGLLLAKRNESHPTELADLKGKRMVAAIEVREGRRFDEAMFKWLSGSDTIKARHMREDFFEFDPTHKLIIVANHQPTVSDMSRAFWRRMKMVPFDVVIPENEWDRDLLEKFKQEGDGILAWMVRGCVEWQKQGLGAPEEVKQATEDYRKDQDFLATFLDENCESTEKGEDEEVTVGRLYDRFKSWAEENGEKAISRKRLSVLLKQRGHESYQSEKDRFFYWRKLKLRTFSQTDSGAQDAKNG